MPGCFRVGYIGLDEETVVICMRDHGGWNNIIGQR